MTRLSRLILVFAVACAVFILVPGLLARPFGPYPLMQTGDAVDVLTPLMLLPLYWLLYRSANAEPPGQRATFAFLIAAVLFVDGHGMHLSANSIGHVLRITWTDAYGLTHFYDEVLSHYLWTSGTVGLAAVVIVRESRCPLAEETGTLRLEGLAGVIYGLTFFIDVVESGTTPLGIPFAVLVTAFGVRRGLKGPGQRPILAFFLVAGAVATTLFAVWGIYWGGWPQLSEVGIP